MSQPESAVADAQAGGASPLPEEPLAELAARYGLRRAIARPPLGQYLRQLWERRHFIRTYATSRNVSKYSNSALGQLWQVLTPLLNAGVYYVMFGVILGAQNGIPNYPAFLITGIFVFTYTQRSVLGGSRSISSNLGLVRALHFPRGALPIAYTVQELQQLAVSMCVLMVLVVAIPPHETITIAWLLIPVVLLLQTMFNIGAAMAMARVGAMVRDTSQLLPFVMRFWLYASGVFFSIPQKLEKFPEWIQVVMQFNPAATYIELMRDILIESHRPAPYIWPFAIFWAVFGLAAGFWYFWRAEERYGRG
ncbi:ABC transporter permease [Bailinhaonella thermotolerans]|uniref:Transport permease protein n=1 Tax=Bailinhaonella thermotolerans TaxID=1070861 RepID=A0A3A4AU77_9ACTN|nr:ABC transporter permease [Bailinhaonella thermotolerans]RJL33115.1 ABC transporter permease [Bailinhaonella thermotolerans]